MTAQPINLGAGSHRLLPGLEVDQAAFDAARQRLALPERLFNLDQLDCLYEEEAATLWTFMRPHGRPSFNPAMLADFTKWQEDIATAFGPTGVPLDFLVLGSRVPGVFCYGGDLDLFGSLIRAGDRAGLIRYGRACVEILHRNMACLDLPMITIGLVQGEALGGGWEALMSFNVIIAERGVKFGLPEIKFNLFPGMGAHAILARKVGAATAERMIHSGEDYTAEQLHALGLVQVLAEPGEGMAAVRDYIAKQRKRLAGHVGSHRAMRMAKPITLDELVAIVTEWADTALKLSDADLKMMRWIVNRQRRYELPGEEIDQATRRLAVG
ncbi:MAG: crotonase/enoyl-CoA hydratase family protein [Sphingopyxis sp.]|nr:crotonase/enoyl-CoA hydratase family protein [Sphingopyxis sp.]